MEESENNLSDSVHHLTIEGRDIYLIGTAHVSKQSVEDVRSTIETVKPDTICIELCDGRYKTMTNKDAWKNANIFKIIKEKKGVLLLAQIIMSAFYRQLGQKLGVEPGAEMLEGINQAEKTGAELVLADRDIQITLKRVWGYLGFWNKIKMMASVVCILFSDEKVDEKLVEEMKNSDQLENIMAEFTKAFPEVKKRLIDERDIYLAQKIRQAKGNTITAVVGAGHIPGIKEHIQKDEPLNELMEIPKKSPWPRILKWAVPLLIIAVFVIGFFKTGSAETMQSIWIWILVNGTLSAAGAAIALGHPLTILSAFLGAPLTSINPFFAAGWVAGLVQAVIRKPTVADFVDLPNAVSTLKGFWHNPVIKILMVMALANVGSMLGTFIAAGWIAARTF